MVKHEHTRGVPAEHLKLRSSKTAGNAPKTRILLILSLSLGIPLILVQQIFFQIFAVCTTCNTIIVLHVVHTAKIGSARTRSCRVLPYSVDWYMYDCIILLLLF